MAVQDAAVHAFRFTNLALNAAVMLHARLAGNKALVLPGAAVPPAAPGPWWRRESSPAVGGALKSDAARGEPRHEPKHLPHLLAVHEPRPPYHRQ